jgi:hypothetical protein
VECVFGLQLSAEGVFSCGGGGLWWPADYSPVDERALAGGRAFGVAGEQVGQYFSIEVAHGHAMADAAEPVDGGTVSAEIAERRGQVRGQREGAAPAVRDRDAG